ncbi:4-alpha-glucanotransferase [Pseudobutyrivibrio sp. NOR37]|uniref:4-alpha-glucanotransferase n=1 Tax=Pseudobutyrivibrio xylanivorans TaxID=185007 RepID=A0A6M0LHE5_PSEXY|nr:MULTISPECIES: 4-alpha-glucanotransferase [Pseudobutyrivibrio]NEX00291.1 4-alpha-glucanotransferase [Pseudobutyrivibrio xylanivorans]SFR83860.1 4-alpha-glucanotransferase [Pseudobutyrivibrio sp. NOR37]
MKRSSGILFPISSLPSPYGIGTFGKAAYEFADFLKAAGQKYWQVLPLGPTSYGDSPYQSFSTNAGNPYFIDLDMLIEDGLLTKEDVKKEKWGTNPRYVDYGQIYISRFKVLEKAKERGYKSLINEIGAFVDDNPWVENYALFMALKKHFNMISWQEWPEEDIRLHDKDAVLKYKMELSDDMEFYIFIQYLFFKQWDKLKKYINDLGIEIIGDLPIYVALDSCDVWAEPEFFSLDDKNYPVEVAGVPPDYFSADGQLWGNPCYNWDAMKKDGYRWWLRRIEGAVKLYDVLRIDHFRGFDEYWAVPAGESTAKNGQWKPGPGMDLVGLLSSTFPKTEFIAEDLGQPSPTVVKLLNDSKWPGMKVLEFAFDSGEANNYQPHTYDKNCICYTGTHDNATVMEWYQTAKKADRKYAKEYLGISRFEKFNWGMIRGGMSSVAVLFVAQMQDYLGLGKFNRINVPGTKSGNWQWRLLKNELSDELAEKILQLVHMYER